MTCTSGCATIAYGPDRSRICRIHNNEGLRVATGERQFVVDEQGKAAVLLPIAEYEALLADLDDLAVIADRRDEPTESLETVRKRLVDKWRHTESKRLVPAPGISTGSHPPTDAGFLPPSRR